MKKQKAAWTLGLVLLALVASAPAQDSTQSASAGTQAPEASAPQNIQAYVDLLRTNVRQDKAEEVGAVMQLSAADAAKFWPIYDEYDKELSQLNDMRVANIQDYANSYDTMTDEKADALIQKGLSFRKQRSELLAKSYEQMKQALGGIEAARFIQVEGQLLLIIDLQIYSALPIVD